MEAWAAVYLALGALAILFAVLLGTQTWEHRRYARSRVAHPGVNLTSGRVALIVPCKGSDDYLRANLRALFEQDHANYELRFVVESWFDPACATIYRLIAEYPRRRAQLIVAGDAREGGQKVHNLLAATEHLPRETNIIAFVDADVRPNRDWLRRLTARLDHHPASTGYRWFVPERPTPANCILTAANAVAATLMSPGIHHYVWGGSWSIRREAFEAGRLREKWRGTLSDDLVATRMLSSLDGKIAFEPGCTVPSPLDVDAREMFGFLRRQLTIARVYTPRIWAASLAAALFSQAAFWGSLAAFAWSSLRPGPVHWSAAAIAGTLYVLSVCRAWLRQESARVCLADQRAQLSAARQYDLWLGPMIGLVCCIALVASAVGRRIVWKGIEYEMSLDGKARRINPPAAATPTPRGVSEAHVWERGTVPFCSQGTAKSGQSPPVLG